MCGREAVCGSCRLLCGAATVCVLNARPRRVTPAACLPACPPACRTHLTLLSLETSPPSAWPPCWCTFRVRRTALRDCKACGCLCLAGVRLGGPLTLWHRPARSPGQALAAASAGRRPGRRTRANANTRNTHTDVEEGGETVFLREGRENRNKPVTDYKTCSGGAGRPARADIRRCPPAATAAAMLYTLCTSTHACTRHTRAHTLVRCPGFKYRPRRGDAVLFHSLTPDGTIDPRSLHGGCPVVQGEKWVATKW